ncbi:type II restriction enzyme [Corynebacterium flavescens]|uniref:type II restriction enzyme n=1 Tax=Corynebacterium flavescens TaxID=28028 RepID=UPI003FD3D4AA
MGDNREEEYLRRRFEVPAGQALGLNDIGWLRAFDAQLSSEISTAGFARVSAQELKALSGREPRLMAKHDFSTSRPWIFEDLGLSILPLSRSSYLIGPFNLYERFPVSAGVLRTLAIPSGIESLDFSALRSEALVLSAAALSGMIEDFIGGSRLVPTVAGRMSTGRLPLHLREMGKHFTVDRAQMEIDAGFESPEHLVLVEAKNHITADFNIRQLYFPYLRFSRELSKEVIPLYLVYSNGVFHLYRYTFTDPEDFRSIRLAASTRYVLGDSAVSIDSLRTLLDRIKPRIHPRSQHQGQARIPFPQADSFARVVSLCELLLDKDLDKTAIHAHYGFTPRQADYYVNAGRYLGLIDLEGSVARLTALGRSIMETPSRDDRNLALVEVMAGDEVFHAVLEGVVAKQRGPQRSDVLAIMESSALEMSSSTLKRRAGTVMAWAHWVWDLVAPRQLKLA